MIGIVLAGPAGQEAADQLHRLAGVDPMPVSGDVPDVLARLAELLAQADGPVVLTSGATLLHDEALAEVALDPRRRTAATVSAGGTPSTAQRDLDVRRRGGQVVSAGSADAVVREPDAAFAGALVVGPADLADAAAAITEMASVARRGGASGDPLRHVLVALVRRGVAVAAVDIDPWPWARVATAEQVTGFQRAAAAVDAPGTKMARALRPDDGFYSTFVVRRLSRRLTPLALRLGLRPNQITVASLLVGLLAAGAFALGGRGGLVAGALLLQLSLVVDCVDGEVARYTRLFSPLGAWLDASTDRIKEYACYAGLAYGALDGGTGGDLWLLATAMLSLQTTRHTTDYTFTLVKNVREGTPVSLPLDRLDDAPEDRERSAAERALRASERSNERPAVRWAKKAVYLPIGERWLVISLAAALGSAYWVFGALLTLGLVALGYTTAARLLRSRTWTAASATDREREVVRAQLDRGPLGSALSRVLPWRVPAGRLAWLLPSLLRAVEFGTVLVVVRAVAPDAMPAAFALLFAVAYHHYDALYRVLNGLPSAGALRAAGLGFEGRLLVVGALALAGPDVLRPGLAVMAVVLGVLFVGVGTTGGVRALRAPAPGPRRSEALRV